MPNTDVKDIQTQVASLPTEPPKTPEIAVGSGEQPKPQGQDAPVQEKPLSREEFEQLKKDFLALQDSAKRDIQSAKDKSIAEVQRAKAAELQARIAEERLARIKAGVAKESPDLAKDIELDDYRAKEEVAKRLSFEETHSRQLAENAQRVRENLESYLDDKGIDRKDPRVDWGDGVTDYATGYGRFLKSVAKIEKEVTAKKEADLRKVIEEDLKAKNAKESKELRIESVDVPGTTPSSGTTYTLSQVNSMDKRAFAEFQKKHNNKSILQLISEGIVKDR